MCPKTLLSLSAFVLVLVAPSRAAEKSAVPFRELSFDAARAAAKAEDKLVFIDFYTTWCEPCKRLDKDTWTDAAVGKLVGDKAVALKLDAEKEGRAVAQRYKVDAYPTLLLLKADGTEVDRIIGYRDPAKFAEEFSAGAAGKGSVARAVEAVARAADAGATAPGITHDAVKARYDLARTLLQTGKYEESLGHYLWCYDEGMIKVSSYAGVRTSFLTSDIGRLAAKYPPAREALEKRRDDAKARLLNDTGDRRAPLEFSALNEALGENQATLAVFEQLPAGDVRRRGLGLRVYRELLVKQRYAEAVEAQPYDSMSRMFDMTVGRAMKGVGPAEESTWGFALRTAAGNVEALAGAGDIAHANDLIGKILAADSSAGTKDLLREHLARAKHPELIEPAAAKP